MKNRTLVAMLSLSCIVTAVWMSRSGTGDNKTAATWQEVAPGILRSTVFPAGHALVDGDAALLIDAPDDAAAFKGKHKIETVLLTHYHREVCRGVPTFLKQGIKVRAAKGTEEWLSPKGVANYWKESLPLRNSRTAYLVVPEGFEGIDYSLEGGQSFSWRGWDIQVIATPGHARNHVAIAARKGKDGPLAVFCGGALAAPGKMWAPYTTDWDHWTDQGLKPSAESLRALAKLKPAAVYPAHGPPITANTVDALTRTAEVIDEVGFMKSFERFSKQRLKNPPAYAFLAKEQAGSAGQLPWSKISDHLYLTGNTYVLVSKDNAVMVFDPWGKRSVEQVQKLQKDKNLGPIELVMFSHAHYDHYDGVYDLPGRDKYQVWSLDEVAAPLADPWFYRAPFLDPRPIKFDRRLKDRQTATWREYTFRFHHFPGQTYFTMAVETTIDGKKCLFTADNFFHIDLYSGSGGWMGLNRSWPGYYAASAQKILDLRPEWVLAEHGGAFEFNAEDIGRRVRWGEAAAKACDALSPTGNHRHDWDPHRLHIEPLVHKAKAGASIKATLVASSALGKAEKLEVVVEGHGRFRDQKFQLQVAPVKPLGGIFKFASKIPFPREDTFSLCADRKGKSPLGAMHFWRWMWKSNARESHGEQMHEPDWRKSEETVYQNAKDAILRFAETHTDELCSLFAIVSDFDYGDVVFAFDTLDNSLLQAKRRERHVLRSREEWFGGKRDPQLVSPPWELAQRLLSVPLGASNRIDDFNNGCGHYMYEDFGKIHLSEWLAYSESGEFMAEDDRQPSPFEGNVVLVFWKVLERLITEDIFFKLHISSPFRAGYQLADSDLVVLRILNWPPHKGPRV